MFLYRIITNFIYPFLIVLIFFRKLRNKEHQIRYKEKIFPSSFKTLEKNNSKLIWFHAASIGEIRSILPVIEKLNKNSSINFLVTTVTLSSSEFLRYELKKYKNVIHRFFPLDVNFIIKKFLDSWKPDIVMFVDSEIWPNLILEIKNRNIPLAIINARITSKTYNKWKIFPSFAKNIFNNFNLCLTSNHETSKFLRKLGAKNIIYTGNIKIIKSSKFTNTVIKHKKQLIKKKYWCALSTHKNEENFCLDAHKILKKKLKDIVTVIAPRHIDRVYEIEKICQNFNLSSQIINRGEKILSTREILIINSFGTISNYLKDSKSVFIGKSLFKKFRFEGGQSPIDAARSGCKIYHGKYIYNFKEIYQLLLKNKISRQVSSSSQLASYLLKDFNTAKTKNKKFLILMKKMDNEILNKTMFNLKKLIKNEII